MDDRFDLFGEESPKNMPEYFWSSASPPSFDYDSAVKASVSQQSYTVCPRYWYVDAYCQCEYCAQKFLFSKEEQKHWYEELKFYVDSHPVRCKSCQKIKKELANEINYVSSFYMSADKAEKVKASLKHITDRFGFLPVPLKEKRAILLYLEKK